MCQYENWIERCSGMGSHTDVPEVLRECIAILMADVPFFITTVPAIRYLLEHYVVYCPAHAGLRRTWND